MMSSIVLAEVVVGAFFAISGYHKLFNGARHKALVETLKADGVPAVWFNQYWVPFWELAAGAIVSAGTFLPVLVVKAAAVVLLIICSVATCVDGVKRIAGMKPHCWADWLDDLLYLPEVLLTVLLLLIILQ